MLGLIAGAPFARRDTTTMSRTTRPSAPRNDETIISSDTVTLHLTGEGGHMAPVVFFPDSPRPIRPYYISPWQGEPGRPDEPVLRMLRGDFFCCPFGANPPWRGERHRVHGEPAYARWTRPRVSRKGTVIELSAAMDTRVRPGRITKRLALRDGESVVYAQHTLEGYRGRMPLGHHATLVPPPRGALRISTSPIRFGYTAPRASAHVSAGEYYALAGGARFSRLERVPTIWRDEPTADCSVFPAREGFVDILSVYAAASRQPAWTCAAAPEAGYLWFSLKDPSVLPATTMWMENRGRHHSPWNGRNCCIGLEEVCAYQGEGLGSSVRPNPIRALGIPTSVELHPGRPTTIRYIQGVARVPRTFDRVRAALFGKDRVTFVADSGARVEVSVRHRFLRDGLLA